MTLTEREVKKFKIIRLNGQLIAGEAVSAFRTRIRELLDGDTKHLAIDLAGLDYLDSAGIGAIAAISFAAEDVDAELRFFGASTPVMDILTKVNLHRALQLFPDESTAFKK